MVRMTYSPEMKIENLDQLPRGLNLPYLECILGPQGQLVAKQWRKVIPTVYEVIVKL